MNSYLRLFFGISIVSPLVFAFFALDFDKWTAFWITFVIYAILYTIGVLMFNYLQTGHPLVFEPSPKWELIEENKLMIEKYTCPYTLDVHEIPRRVNVYRKPKRNGMVKFKVIKIF